MRSVRQLCASILAALLLAALLGGSAARASAVPWRRLDAGFVRTATITDIELNSPRDVYVSLYEPKAVYHSSDGGSEWQWLGEHMPPLVPLSLLADAHDRLWVGTVDGLWVLYDDRWESVTAGPTGSVYALARWVGEELLVGSESGLFVCSTKDCRPTDVTSPVLSLASRAGSAYVGTATDGLWAAGVDSRWSRLAQTAGPVNDLAVGATADLYYVSGGTLYHCQEEGACTPLPLPSDARARAVVPHGDFVTVGTAGQGMLTDGPANGGWHASPLDRAGCRSAGAGSAEVTALAWDSTSGMLLAGTAGAGLYSSLDNGLSWSHVAATLGHVVIHALVRTDSGTLYAGGPAGTYTSADGGSSWVFEQSACSLGAVQCLASDSGRVLAGTAAGVYAKAASDGQWSLLSASAGRQTIFTLAVDPDDSERIFAGCWGNNVLYSPDGGTSWAPMHNGLETLSVYSLAISTDPEVPVADASSAPSHPATRGVIYAGTVEGIYCTVDGGATWEPCGEGVRDGVTVYCLLLSPRHDGVLYAGTTEGLYRSDDRGESWYRLDAPMGTVYACVPCGDSGESMLCGTEGEGAWLSRDGGVVWQPWGLSGRSIYALAEAATGLVLAGTDEGLYGLDVTVP